MSALLAGSPGHIVVEGPIGVGKTSLARRLAENRGCDLLLEAAEENPFLERFYQHPQESALPTQLFFLFQRARQIQSLRQGDLFCSARVSDFMLEKDPLFARVTLSDDELRLYEQVYAQLSMEIPPPDLVVYLQAPVEVLLQRIARRGRNGERFITATYLQKLVDAYAHFFYSYEDAPLLIVNASEIDPVARDEDFELLVSQMYNLHSGRHYFNPIPFSM